ncbi:hypothetical protein [Tenacibaculum discolor]|uniref:hypothetical protein n=1 Tax=Tenacibaculum discolor TaxID=361581 RepID=UPI004039EA75
MKKRKKQIANLLKLGVFLFGFSLLLWNCEKDNNLPQEEETGISQTSELYQAKNWLEKNENDLLILKYTQLIDWDNAILSHGVDGTIIEVPLILNENIVTKMESNKTLLSFHRLVLKKEASNMFSIFHLQITTSNTTFNNSNKAFNYYSLQQNFDGYTTLVDANNKVASFNEFYQGKIITKPESISSREVMTCTYVGWWSNGTFEPISELWCTSEGGSNGEDDGESGYNYGGGGTTSGTTEEQIINNLTGKAKCVYEKLKAMSTDFKNMIQKFDGEFPVSHLKFTINNNLGNNVFGETQPPVNYVTEIQINGNGLSNLSDLGAATTFAHELIHAEIFRKMLSAAQRGDLNTSSMTTQQAENYVNSLKDNFPGLYDYYIERWHPTWNHSMMATHYRTIIADIIQSFDNNRFPRSTYESIAWAGLGEIENNQSTVAWQNLTSTEQQAITDMLNKYFFNGTSNCN